MLKSVNLNEDASLAAVATTQGLIVYSTAYPPLQKLRSDVGALLSAHIVQRSNIFLLVHAPDPDVLVLWDEAKRAPYAELKYIDPILKIVVRGKHFAVATSSAVHVHRLVPPEEIYKVSLCAGVDLCSLSLSLNLVVGSATNGKEVTVLNSSGKHQVAISAHNHDVRVAALSSDGALLATVSERGTVVHIYDLSISPPSMKELRRSTSGGVVSSISFSANGCMVACSGDFGVAVWCLQNAASNARSPLQFMGSVVPYFSSEFPCASRAAEPNDSAQDSVIAFGRDGEVVHVVYGEGKLRSFKLQGAELVTIGTTDLLR